MDDNTLADYIPNYGDRIAARRFCLQHSATAKTKESAKHSMLEKLKKKMGITVSDDENNNQETSTKRQKRHYAKCNKFAEKKTRKVELGWIHEGKQVRKRKGGGTRTLDVPKESKKADILQYAKDIFFPNGKNKLGNFDTFSYDIVDYQEEAIFDDAITVGELYSVLRMGVLRFYLCTKVPKDEDAEESVAEESTINQQIQNSMHEEDEQPLQTVDTEPFLDTSVVMIGPFLGEPTAGQLDDTLLYQPDLQVNEDTAIISVLFPSASSALIIPDTASDNSSNMSHSTSAANIAPESAAIDDVAGTSTNSSVNITIKLHRVNLLEEMIAQFKDSALLKHSLRYTFIDERGADHNGVSRDVYAAFWTQLLDHTAEGEDLRVPSLCPKWQEKEWKSIGRILLKGFQDHGYFPCRLSPAFAVSLIFGENEVSDDVLFESLLQFVSQSDRKLITTALKEDLSEDDQDELIDLLDRLDVTALPTRNNLKGILLKVAHKQLIQKPRYACEKMSLIAGASLKEAFVNTQHVLLMYEDKKPTTKKLLKLLEASPSTQAENQSFRFLKQYIRGFDDVGLRRMLRFMTGSDVVFVDKIDIMFTSADGLARRPVAHTCGPVLELPWTYASYPELRTEFDGILINNTSYEFSIM
ncbi:uncharacterized protein LOC111189939 [Astyanax mexicanus]|uniref:uncharacterized protein LOC111189939 n=1 Tax=Astyanax mexicanus TaxID=7994 RepID=UPI0020CB1095|nr:uncharacterized protein LOC111189939 [Astyanax mexicanus]